MLVGEIMTSPALTVRDDARPEVAVHLLAERRLTMLPCWTPKAAWSAW